MADLLSLGAPSYRELASHRRYRQGTNAEVHGESWGRYTLCERIPCGPGDECFAASHGGSQFVVFVFLRRFPAAWLDDAWLDGLKARALLTRRGIEQVHEVARHEQHGFVVTDLIEGLALDRLDDILCRRGERLPWPVALAIFHDAYERISYCRAAGVLRSEVTPARLRLSLDGMLQLCGTLPEESAPVWGRALCEVARASLGLAADAEERALLDDILDDDIEGALEVASDAIVERHPEIDPLLPSVLFAALDGTPLAMDRVRARLLDRLDRLDVGRLWQLVAENLGPAPAR